MGDRPYHHGALRPALLAAGLALAAERGPEGFSLREAARRAGVSHGAPYHHFADRDALLRALAEDSFEVLGRRLTQATEGCGDPLARLDAVAEAYVAFGLEQPARFRLMWRHDPGRPSDSDDLERRSLQQPSFGLVAGCIVDAERAGAIVERPDDVLGQERAAVVWAAVHGLTELLLSDQFGPDGPALMPARLLGFIRAGLGGADLSRADLSGSRRRSRR